MRRLVIAVTLLVAASFASDTLLTQNFNGSWAGYNPPPGWRIFYMHGGVPGRGVWDRHFKDGPWIAHPSAFAAIYPATGMGPSPDSLISPLIDCRNHKNVTLRCSTNFIGGPNAYQAQVIYSIDGGVTYPYVARDYHGDSTGTVCESLVLDQAPRQANVKVCWVFTGNKLNFTSWCLDDVAVTGEVYTNILFTQDFNSAWSTNNPPAGWRIFHTQPGDSGPDDWHRDLAHTAPWNYHPSPFAAIQPSLNPDAPPDSLISPVINCTGYRNIALVCSTFFYYWSSQPYTAQLVYSTDSGATWPYVLHDYRLNHTTPPAPILETLSLSQATGKAHVQLAWVFNGDLNLIQRWFVDDVVVAGDSIVTWDVACESIVSPSPSGRVPPGLFTPSALFRNLGTNLQLNVPVGCSLYTDQMAGLAGWTGKIDALLPDTGQKVVSFSPPYDLSVGNYFIKFWSAADSDHFRDNDTLYRYFEASPLRGLSYDDGTAAQYKSWPVGHNGWGVKFDADTSPVYIESLYVYLQTPATANYCGYQLAVFLDDGTGHPGKLYFKTPVQYAAHGTNAWNAVYVGGAGDQLVMPNGQFHVFYLQVGEPPECPALGLDATRNPLASNWKYRSGVMTPDSTPGDFMIRAVVNMTQVTPAPVDLRTLYVDQPLYDFVQRPFDAPITPKGRVQNFGSQTVAPVSVQCDIIGPGSTLYYTNTQTLASLAPGQDTLVTFPDWVPTKAERDSVVIKTLVSGGPDPVPQNDEKRFAVDVLKGTYTGVSTLKYHWIDSDTTGGPTYAWIDTNKFNNGGSLGDNGYVIISFEPGMYFPYYDSTYNNVVASANGWVALGSSIPPDWGMDTVPGKLPSLTAPNRCVYAWWDNLAMGAPFGHGSLRYKWFGSVPNRYMVVVFQDVSRMGADTSNGITFELIFRENGTITCQYKDVETGDLTFDNGRNSCIGLENKDGSDGLCYLYARPPLSTSINGLANRLSPGRAITFFPDRRDAAAVAIVKPASYEFPGQITPQAVIQNVGTVPDSIRVFMTIGNTYADDTLVIGLAAGDSTLVSFAPWTAQLGTYPVCCSVHMVGDVNPSNNVVTEMINIAAWTRRADIPPSWRRRTVKSGALCYAPTTHKLYALKGSNSTDFWEYDIAGDSWDTLASIPLAPSGSRPRDGAHLTFDPNYPIGNPTLGRIWAIKGGGRADFYYYDIARDSWVSKRPMIVTYRDWPYSGRPYHAPKKGAAIEYVATAGTQGSVYGIPGQRTNYFWRYDIAKDSWLYPHDSIWTYGYNAWYWQYVPLDVPLGPLGIRCKDGADLAYLNGMLYLLKGSNTVEAYGFSPLHNAWSETLDVNSFYGHAFKRVKAGGSLVANDDRLYALKGGSTQEFWHYNFVRHLWQQSSDIPFAASGRRVKVKLGSAMASVDSVIFCLKGSSTNEFWEYGPGADTMPLIAGYQPDREGVMAGQVALDLSKPWLVVYPNPTRAGLSINYNVTSTASTCLRVYDASGKLVANLWDATRSRGHYVTQWSGLTTNGRQVPAGVYFVKLESGETRLTQKLIVQR